MIRNSKTSIQNKYWLEFIRWIGASSIEEKIYYQRVVVEDEAGNVHVSIARNEHNFWYWWETHKMKR